ncbi:MAG: putative porin [Planctomycetota bacterium]|jgi:hypothetical protein
MKQKKVNVFSNKLILIMLVLVMAVTQDAKADEIDDLKQQLVEQQKMLLKMQQRLEQLEKQQTEAVKQAPVSPADQKQLELMVNKMFEENKSDFVAPDWVKNITPFGDLRYRYESLQGDDADSNLTNDRRRNRIRARLGFKAKINDEWDTIFRIATGSSDAPTSTNQTLDGAFESKDLWLDLAYADWHPERFSGLNVFMGKMKNVFYRVGGNQLIWDSDVNPEGGAAKYNWNLSNSTMATFIGGAFWLDEREADADAGYFGIQAMLKREFDDGSHLLGGLSYYDIGNIDSKTVGGVTLQGNTPTTPGGSIYKYDYDIVEGFAEYGWKYNGMPVAVFGNYLENTAAPGGRNMAYSIGTQLNKAKKPDSWQLKASYREVESDAVFGGLSDSDFIDGGTGGKGWVLGFKYQLAKNIQAALTYFINDRDRRSSDASGGSGSQNFNRLQADLIFKF